MAGHIPSKRRVDNEVAQVEGVNQWNSDGTHFTHRSRGLTPNTPPHTHTGELPCHDPHKHINTRSYLLGDDLGLCGAQEAAH